MGGTLAGKTIASTYKDVLTINSSSDNDGITGTLVKVEDGAGTDTSLSISTTDIAIDQGDKFFFDSGGDTYIWGTTTADVVAIDVGGTNLLKLKEDGGGGNDYVQIPTNTKLYIGGNTYLIENPDDHVVLNVGAVQMMMWDQDNTGGGHGTIEIGIDGEGCDVIFWGETATTGYAKWDQSQNYLVLGGSSRIGIGTDGPQAPLHVKTTTQSEVVKIQAEGFTCHIGEDSDLDNYCRFRLESGDGFHFTPNNDSPVLTLVTASGNVGINAVAPASKLHVNGTVQVGVDNTGYDVKFYGATTGAYMLWDESEDMLELDIGTADGPALRINTSNNRYKDIQWVDSGTVKSHIRFIDDSSGTDGQDRLVMGTATDLDVVTIKGGSVGFGGVPQFSSTSVTDNYRIDVQANSSLSGTSHTGYAMRVLNDGDNADRGGIRIVCGADTGAGETIYLSACDGDGNEIGSLRHNASGTDFSIVATSDERLKENIADTAIAGLNTINALKVRDFDWKRSGESVKGGFVAQEVKTVMPEAVSGTDGATYTKIAELPDENGNLATSTEIDPMGVSQSRMIPTLVKAVQELSAKVTALENA